MISIKTLYYDVGNAVKGICDKVYPRNRPKSVCDRPDSYIVVSFPSSIYNNEMNDDGSFNDYTTTAQIEIYVRDKTSARNPNTLNVSNLNRQHHRNQAACHSANGRRRRFFGNDNTGLVKNQINAKIKV